MLLASIFFLLIALVLGFVEANRRPDLLSIAVVVFAIQIVIPGILIPFILALEDSPPTLDHYFYDRIYRDLTADVVVLSGLMAALFLVSLYATFSAFRFSALREYLGGQKIFEVVVWRYASVLIISAVSAYLLISSMPGDGYGEKYVSLVLFRADHESVIDLRNFLTANLFALTQTFAILSVLAFLIVRNRIPGKWWVHVFVLLPVVLVFGVMAASRRMILIQLLLLLFAYVLMKGRWPWRAGAVLGALGVLVLVLGKEFLAQVQSVMAGDSVTYGFDLSNISSVLLAGLSSLGITLNSSWATFMYLDAFGIRFGADHLFSVLRFLPLGSLGVDEEAIFPRIVRMSTDMFVGPGQQDIPPGLFGQMWLDFGILGPIVWGVFYGVALRILQTVFEGYKKNWSLVGVFAILVFVLVLPFNTGSLDFNFSVDMFFVIVFVLFVSTGRWRNIMS